MDFSVYKFVERAKNVLRAAGEESFIDNQRSHVFCYFLLLLYASFLLYMFVVVPSTWFYGVVNGVFCLIEILLTVLFFWGKLPLKKTFSWMLLAIQIEICFENVICAFHLVQYPRLLIMANMLLSFMFIMIAACAYLDRISYVLGGLSLTGFVVSAYITEGPFLFKYIALIIILLLFASLLGHTVYINALRLEKENKTLKSEERKVLKFLRISRKELMALVELSSKENSEEETNLLIEKLGPKAKENLFTALYAHSQAERTQMETIKQVFPQLSFSEQTICRLILQDKTIAEICEILYRTSGTVTSQRARIRSKLGLKRDEILKEVLQQKIDEWEKASRRRKKGLD